MGVQWTQQARGGGGAISGQGQYEVERGLDKSWTRGSWSTHMGLPAAWVSYNPLNKADHLQVPTPGAAAAADCVSAFSPTPQPFLSFSVLSNFYKEGRIVIMQRRLAATRAELLFTALH